MNWNNIIWIIVFIVLWISIGIIYNIDIGEVSTTIDLSKNISIEE